MKICIALTAMLSALLLQNLSADTFTDENGTQVLYRTFEPDDLSDGKKYPLILFLHGSGERGTDNVAQIKNGVADMLEVAAKLGEKTFLIAPQCPPETSWVQTKSGHTHLKDVLGENALLAAVLALVEQAKTDLPIDPNRIYLTGLSMGGFGSFALLAKSPETWAAAMPICGAGDPGPASLFKDVPLRIIHGGADEIVPPKGSELMAEALKNAGATDVKLIIYPGVGHDSWTQTYKDKDLLTWLFAQRKSP